MILVNSIVFNEIWLRCDILIITIENTCTSSAFNYHKYYIWGLILQKYKDQHKGVHTY